MHWYMSWVGTGLGHAWNCLHEAQNFHGGFCCSFFAPLPLLVWNMLQGGEGRVGRGEGGLRLGVNIVKCRNGTT